MNNSFSGYKRSSVYQHKRKMLRKSEEEYESHMNYLWDSISKHLMDTEGKKLTNEEFHRIINDKEFDIQKFKGINNE